MTTTTLYQITARARPHPFRPGHRPNPRRLCRADARLTLPANLILLFLIGRCGTTLANHILNTAPDTSALSEPRALVTLALAPQP